MGAALDLVVVQQFGTALLIGALIGLERERHRASEHESESPGLRTFIVVAQIGAISGWLAHTLAAPWLVAAGLAAVAATVVAGYVVAARQQPESIGITTEVTALAVCLLGAMTTLGYAPIAIGLGVTTAALLAYKQPLHGLVARLGWDDVSAGLRLLIATFIVLPLLPDQPIDPWGALNPASLWRLVLLISSLSLVGYVATRWLGERKGTTLTGLTGGLVSSTAVTLSFARQSREDGVKRQASSLAGGILLAWTVMFARVVVEVFVVNPALVPSVLVPFATMAAMAGVFAVLYFRRAGPATAAAPGAAEVPLKNPFSLTAAVKFAAFFAVVLVLVEVARRSFAAPGLYAVAALAGLTDVDAITLSMAAHARSGDVTTAVGAIVTASMSNTLVKAGMVAGLGSAGIRRDVVVATAAIVAAGAGALLLW